MLQFVTRALKSTWVRVVAGVVQLAEAVGAGRAQAGGHADADRHGVAVQLAAQFPSLVDERPAGDDGELGAQEDGGGDDEAGHVDAQARVAVRYEHGLAADVGLVQAAVEAELVGDLDGLDEEHVVVRVGGGATLPATERDDGAEFAARFLLVALDGLAGRHARGDEGAELDHLG